jgi:hypothetical protein
MWLINSDNLKLENAVSHEAITYAILSHTWGDDEVTFQDFHDLKSAIGKKGFTKIRKFCEIAKNRGIKYAWVDTCCIDKTSSAELSEAINSMYRWYQDAYVCLVYLEDVEDPDIHKGPRKGILGSAFATCK